jgi:sugar/nucleoside kinase (ribokinase family)
MNDDKYFDAVGFGITTLDYVCLVDRISTYNKQANISDVKFLGGGIVSTALVTIQRLGGNTAMYTVLGNDYIAKEISKELKQEGIDCSFIDYENDVLSTFSFIQVNKKSGKRAISYYSGSGSLLKFSNKVKNIIKKGKILLLDGMSPKENLKAAIFAHENNVKVMLDAHIVLKGTKELLSNVDYLITSESFLFEYTKNKNIESGLKELYRNYNPDILVTTLGKKGSVALVNNKLISSEIFSVKVKDTTGCGDVYHGAFLYGLLKKWDLKDIMVFATAVSSIKCMYYGGRIGIPDFKKTINFLNDFGVDTAEFCKNF